MAACRRVPLMLLMSVLLYMHPIRGQKSANSVIANTAVRVNIQAQNQAAVPAAVNGGSPVVAASPPRRRSSGWKLAEEGACREDLTRLCPKHSWNNNLAVLECLQDRKEVCWIVGDIVARPKLGCALAWLYSS